MARVVKLWALGSFTHALLTFTLSPLVWVLPDGIAAEIAGVVLDVILQPFMGPHRLLAADRLLSAAQGLPAMAATSALWGLLFTGVVGGGLSAPATQLAVARTGDFVFYMVIEDFRGGRPEPVYARFRERGRMAPEGLLYVTSWVTTDGARCFQVMECADRALLDRWMAAWADLVEFTVIPVTTSAEAAERFTPPGIAQQLEHR